MAVKWLHVCVCVHMQVNDNVLTFLHIQYSFHPN